MNILVINAGSSSLKYQFFQMPSESDRPLCSGLVEKIGVEGSFIRHKIATGKEELTFEFSEFVPDHGYGLNKIIELLTGKDTGVVANADAIDAVGHRVVHGGNYFSGPTRLTEDVKSKIGELSALAPLHNPVSLDCIELAASAFVNAEQVAVFDTAFHQTMPQHAFMYAIPPALYEKEKIRTYGFHGTSHYHVTKKTTEWLKNPEAKIISIHLGNGCSITAVNGGKSMDTSMGFGPLSGLIMGTRSGDIDPSVIFHLSASGKYTVEDISRLFNRESGLLGFAGSNDMRDVRKMHNAGNQLATLILDMYVYRIKKYIGAYIAALNGVDAIIFTAGVGENDYQIRESVCSAMDYLGIKLDVNKNKAADLGLREISREDGAVRVLVVPTNEELEIAQQTYHLCTGS